MTLQVERIPIDTSTPAGRKHWLEKVRVHDITASVTGALFGVHPYVSALRLYLLHSGVEFPNEENAVMRRGRLMEPTVGLAVAEERPQWQITKAVSYYRDPELRLGCTPDFFISGDPRGTGVLQTKTAAPDVYARDWEGGKTVPFWIQLQNLTECMLTGAAFGAVGVVQVHAYDLACSVHEIPRHPAAEQRIIDAVKQFWADVEAGREPPADYGKDAELIKLIAPREMKGKSIDLSADNEIPVMLAQREEIMTSIDRLAARKEEIETAIRFRMRDAEAVSGLPEWSISYRTQHRNEFVVPAKDVRTLRIHHKGAA